MTLVHAPGVAPPDLVHGRKRRLAIALVVLTLAAVVVVTVLWPRPGTAGFTGVTVAVPGCPASAQGCLVVATDASAATQVAHDGWSGAATTLNLVLPAGRYAIAAEGCAGDTIPATTVTVTSGFHTVVDLGTYWQMPGFLGRVCAG
jgi:hypothetical protein